MPAGHWVQLVDPGALQLPKVQHTPEPEALYLSSAQGWHCEKPGTLKVFCAHGEHCEDPDMLEEPALHGKQNMLLLLP